LDNLRQQIELDLHDSIESEWKVEVELTGPDGNKQVYSKNHPTQKLGGMVGNYTVSTDPETGNEIIGPRVYVVLRKTSLDRIPAAGETWFIKMPVSPQAGATIRNFVFTPTRSPEGGSDIGFILIYPQEIAQESEPVS
jgi:hypothetical protein